MRRIAVIVTLGLFVACSSSGGGTAASTTPSSASATTTSSTTTTTVAPEDEVRRDWDAYWSMVVRLIGAPVASDPEIDQRAVDPIRSEFRDQLSTRASEGHHVVIPPGAKYRHVMLAVTISGDKASIDGCQIDDSLTVDASGAVV